MTREQWRQSFDPDRILTSKSNQEVFVYHKDSQPYRRVPTGAQQQPLGHFSGLMRRFLPAYRSGGGGGPATNVRKFVSRGARSPAVMAIAVLGGGGWCFSKVVVPQLRRDESDSAFVAQLAEEAIENDLARRREREERESSPS